MMTTQTDIEHELNRLQQSLEHERHARIHAERVAERGLHDLHEKQRELQLLELIAVTANHAPTLDDALELTIDQVCEFYRWQAGHAYLHDARVHDRLNPTAIWYCQDPAGVADFREATAACVLEAGEGLPGRVLAAGQPAWAADIAEAADFPRAEVALRCGLRSALAFPVLVGDRVVAVLEFFSNARAEPDDAMLHLMSQIGLHMGRVAERQFARDKLTYDAFHDVLTGLPNRALFLDRLQRAVARRERNASYDFAVLFLDLDRFKLVNDSLGHIAGDQLLVLIGERIATSLRSKDTISRPIGDAPEVDGGLARLGGDEFTLLLDDIASPTDALRVSERILAALASPFFIHGQDVYINASIGAATPTEDATAEDILRNSDLAMYRAKALGGGRCEFFDRSMHANLLNRMTIENELRHALKNNQFVVHYQPIVSLTSGGIVGVEALVRWQQSPDNLVYPKDFINVAEDTGLIAQLDMWVLREACLNARQWQIEFPSRGLRVSINLSARSFALGDLVRKIDELLTETQVDPASVRLEITESMTMGDTQRTIEVMRELKALGLHLSIDDFGTGYSSLAYLHQFPVDTLKIDRSFVARIDQSNEGFQIIRSIMSLARNLGMQVIAEGPETEGHVRRLQETDCDYGQGYFFSHPVHGDQIHELLLGSVSYAI